MFRVIFLATIIVDFRIRSAGAFADFPEIVLAGNHVLFRNTAFHPKIMGFLVIRIIGDIKLMRIKSIIFFTGEKFIGPGDDLIAEIVADGKVSHHLEEGMMTGGMSDIVDVIGTDAFLGIRDSSVLWGQSAIEIFFQSRNAGIDPQ